MSARFLISVTLLTYSAILAMTLWGRWITDRLRASGYLTISIALSFGAAGLLLSLLAWRWRLSRRAMALLGLVVLLYFLGAFLMHQPEERVHLLTFGMLGALLNGVGRTVSGSVPGSWARRLHWGGMILLTVLLAWLDEGLQLLVPDRFYDLRDIAFNAAAGLGGLLAAGLVAFLNGRNSSAGAIKGGA